eukprot:1649220-Amphidinium_carterae.1
MIVSTNRAIQGFHVNGIDGLLPFLVMPLDVLVNLVTSLHQDSRGFANVNPTGTKLKRRAC